MSDVEDKSVPTDAALGEEQKQQTENGDNKIDENTEDSAQSVDTATKSIENGAGATQGSPPANATLDGDSEAETLIESPEKKRNIMDNAPRLQQTHTVLANEIPVKHEAPEAEERDRTRKRKRTEDQEGDKKASPALSRRSSPLSSPMAIAASNDSDSDVSVRRSARKVEHSRLRRRDRVTSQEADEENVGASVPRTKSRKRRPSDILPHIAKHRTKHQNTSIDNNSLVERRETRSATYPRRSSEDRSPSTEPISRREHKRGASTQLPPLAIEKKRRVQPPPINTRRKQSVNRDSESDSSDSPPASRPRLQKFTSAEHDMLSPAKAMGPKKSRDRSGRTALARACANEDFDGVKQWIKERPDELDLPDYAGNSPLQFAALDGYTEIVRYLLENGCQVNNRNNDKDTPLIDAVENGHVEVVRLLLKHGADPRISNGRGDEPSVLVEDKKGPGFAEIRKLLGDAKKRIPERRQSGDQNDNKDGSSRAASAASPRDSPPVQGPRSPQFAGFRRKTGRSESTRTDLLWAANTPENMTRLAEKGDYQGVVNILQVLDKAPTETMIAAAKGGHDDIVSVLQGMGSPDADPEPIKGGSAKLGYNTPMLAAIGRGNIEVIKLLVRYENKGKVFDPTREYQGRKYYEISQARKGQDWQSEYNFLKSAYDNYNSSKGRKHGSPRKPRDMEKTKPHRPRDSSSPVAVKQRPHPGSPALSHNSLPDPSSGAVRHTKRDISGSSEKARSLVGKANGDPSLAISSDHDQNPTTKKVHKSRRSQSDLPPFSILEGDSVPKRRRLVTGKEHRRAASTTTGAESESDVESSLPAKSERQERQRLKRSRSSLSPERNREENVESSKTMSKKRRTILESSPEEARVSSSKKSTQRTSSRESGQTIEVRSRDKNGHAKVLSDVDNIFKRHKRRKSSQSVTSQRSAEKADAMEDVRTESPKETTDDLVPPNTQTVTIQAPTSLPSEIAEKPPEDTAENRAALERQQEQERIVAEEAAKKAERDALEVEHQRAQDAAEAETRRKAEEVEAKKRAEEEAAARKKEEEERQEQAKRDMEDRRRRQEEQKRQEFLENERRRREALPRTLCETARMLDQGDMTVKSPPWLQKFLPLFCVRTEQIEPNCTAGAQDEEWLPNFQVAGLLATKDLKLTQYTSLEKRPVTERERDALWRVARNVLSFVGPDTSPSQPNAIQLSIDREAENKPKFMAMEDVFWVKYSDFHDQIFRHSHLNGIKLIKRSISVRPFPTIASGRPISESPIQKQMPLTNGISPYMASVTSQFRHD